MIQHFAERFGIKVGQARHLRNLVNRAADAQENEHNTGTSADKVCSQVQSYARKLGIETDWRPGIYPLFKKDGLSEHIE